VFFRIENCSVFNSGAWPDAGIRLLNVNNSKLIGNNCTSNTRGIRLDDCINNTILGNIASNNSYGIYLGNSYNNTVAGNNASNNSYGVSLVFADNNTVSDNTANDNNWEGIELYDCNNNIISGNTANNNYWNGIGLTYGDNNTISGNNASNNSVGVYFYGSFDNRVSGNIMNGCGLSVSGRFKEYSSLDVDGTNLVNGKPLYYYIDEVKLGPNNFTDAGQVILVNCSDSLISNLNISHTSSAISLFYCNKNTVSGNVISNNNGNGILLSWSHNNTISENIANYNAYGIYFDSNFEQYTGSCVNNTVTRNIANNNNRDGIYISWSYFNTISENTANNNNKNGIYLTVSSNNTVLGNTANYNHRGIGLYNSNYNIITGNNLIGNEECIVEENGQGNTFENNYCDVGVGVISGYHLFYLFALFLFSLIILSRKVKKS
jgi:parallel beta-helix repeat protein